MSRFIQGANYQRSQLHKRFGGQEQRGICTPRKSPVILLFTGKRGRKHGYINEWKGDHFIYTGEGQRGDMKMTHGNLAIRDHVANGKELHIFENIGRGGVKYLGQMIFEQVVEGRGHDTVGRMRRVYRFVLTPITGGVPSSLSAPPSSASVDQSRYWKIPKDELRKIAKKMATTKPKKTETTRTVRQRSEPVRVHVLRRADGFCEYCGGPAPFKTPKGRPFLEVHHTERLTDEGPDDPEWVVGLCPNCHRKAHYSKDLEAIRNKLLDIARARELTLGR